MTGPPGEEEAPGPRLALGEQVEDQMGAGSGLARRQGRRRAVVGGAIHSIISTATTLKPLSMLKHNCL